MTKYTTAVYCLLGIAAAAILAIVIIRSFRFLKAILLKRRQREGDAKRVEAQKKMLKEMKLQDKVHKFEEIFGFHPKLLSKLRNRQEVLVRLWFMSDSIYPLILKASRSRKNREKYLAVSKEFMEALDVLSAFSRFGGGIPHWTGLRDFTHGLTGHQKLKIIMKWHDKKGLKLLSVRPKRLKHKELKALLPPNVKLPA